MCHTGESENGNIGMGDVEGCVQKCLSSLTSAEREVGTCGEMEW